MRLRSVRCARNGSLNAETHISAEQSQTRQDARIPRADEEQGRASSIIAPPGPRPPQTDGQRRKSCPHCQGQLISRSPGRRGVYVPPIFGRSMTKASAYPARCARPSAWLDQTRKASKVHGLDSRYPARSVLRWTATESSGVFAKRSGCTGRKSVPSGTSYLTHAGPRWARPSLKSNVRLEK
jgi:hypothetical protein